MPTQLRRASISCLCFIPFLLFLNACDKGSAKPVAEERSYNVQVRAAEKKLLRPFIEAIGSLTPYDEVIVSTEIDGLLKDLLVEEGEKVSKGMLLARIDDTDYALEVTRAQSVVQAADSRLQQLLAGARPQEIQLAKAEVDQTLADLEKRKADLARAKGLYEKNYISAQEWDSARTAYDVSVATHQKAKENYALVVEGPRKEEIDSARAQLDQSKAALALARQKLGKTQIFSPLSGFVRLKKASKGEFLKSGNPLVAIIQSNPIRIRFSVTEKDVGKIKIDQEVSLRVVAFAEREFQGKVSTIYPSLDEKTRTLLVEALASNSEGALKPGLFARVTLYTGRAKETVVVPVTALLYEETKVKIFVEERGRAKEKFLKLGGKYGDVMEVLEGLREGEKIVVGGQQDLSEGVKLHVAR